MHPSRSAVQARPHLGTRLGVFLACAVLLLTACTSTSDSADEDAQNAIGAQVLRQSAARAADGAKVAAARTNPFKSISGPVVVAAGDIACVPGKRARGNECRQAATARLAKSYQPRKALVLGDTQYEDGYLRDFYQSYHRSWGPLRSITKPIPGNHEYRRPKAKGYYTYFRNQTPRHPGYYAFNVANWRVYALNSNCDYVNCAKQIKWLNRYMTRHPRKCTIMMLHHPLYSSGKHGNNRSVQGFWKVGFNHRTEIVLSGHDHHYERFARMGARGQIVPHGIRSFVAGAGGKNLYPPKGRRKGSVVFNNRRPGVLALKLGANRYAWQYQTIDGKVADSGSGTCR